MTEKTPLDLIHARAAGRLSPAESAELERALAADPALVRLAEEYELVHALTGAGGPVPSPRTRFEDLEPRLEPAAPVPERRWPRQVAAAAALLLTGALAFQLGRLSRSTTRPLVLSAIELDELPFATDTTAPELPLAWADYDPRGEGGVRFLSDLGEAELLARTARRPLLVYGSYPGCPLCAALDQLVFSDPQVIDLAERTVPVRIDLAQLSQAEQLSYTRRGYPFLEMWRDDGRTTHSLARNPDPQLFVESLHDGLEKSEATGEQPPWDEIRSWAGSFVSARRAELEGRLAEAEAGFRRLLEEPDAPPLVRRDAGQGMLRLSRGARQLLLEARRTAQDQDLEAALQLLRSAVERYSGTRYERDLRAALERLSSEGRFPALVEGEHSA